VIRVAPLSAEFKVSEETARRDLQHLGKEGCLVRTSGGAYPSREGHTDIPPDVMWRKTEMDKDL
jgi:DeoR/GlpR family transcriptional regulator of sugar metabolism